VFIDHIWKAWYNGSDTIAAEPIKTLELHFTIMIQFFITFNIFSHVAFGIECIPPLLHRGARQSVRNLKDLYLKQNIGDSVDIFLQSKRELTSINNNNNNNNNLELI